MNIEERSGSELNQDVTEEKMSETEVASEPTVEQEQPVEQSPTDREVSKSTEETKPESVSYAEYESLLKEKEELTRQKEDKSKFISEVLPKYRASAEQANQLRAKLQELQKSLPDKNDVWTGDDVVRYQEAENIKQQLSQSELEAVEMHNKAILDNQFPNYLEYKDKLAAELLRLGHSPEQVQIIQSNPYRFNTSDIPIIRGALESIKVKEMSEKAKNGVKSTAEHVKRVQEVASTTTISNSTGSSTSELDIAPEQEDAYIRKLSYEQLCKLVEEGVERENTS